ncbi:MAG: 2OG-Fe(II) oxygenase [Pelagibacteraceae bacterium]|nr:2OG-Fe(II) oxygenase [Pelagibacteraceae bacterium]
MNSNQQLSDYIYYYPEAMDSKTCNTIIKHFDTKAEWKQSTFATAGTNTGSSKVSMEEFWIGSPLPYYKDIEKTFKYCVDDYTSVYTQIKSIQYTDFRINRYGQGGYMKSHIDNIHHSHGQKQGYPHLTSLIFLNDDYEGGDFVLCGDKYIEKVQGSAIVFPSNFMYPHEVKEVTKGKRYSIMTWVL